MVEQNTNRIKNSVQLIVLVSQLRIELIKRFNVIIEDNDILTLFGLFYIVFYRWDIFTDHFAES